MLAQQRYGTYTAPGQQHFWVRQAVVDAALPAPLAHEARRPRLQAQRCLRRPPRYRLKRMRMKSMRSDHGVEVSLGVLGQVCCGGNANWQHLAAGTLRAMVTPDQAIER